MQDVNNRLGKKLYRSAIMKHTEHTHLRTCAVYNDCLRCMF